MWELSIPVYLAALWKSYGQELIRRLATDLSQRLGRGFSQRNLEQMRQFYLSWPIPQTASAEFQEFPLPWSHCTLLTITDPQAREFYERETSAGAGSSGNSTGRPASGLS
jgi:hypothetical protein